MNLQQLLICHYLFLSENTQKLLLETHFGLSNFKSECHSIIERHRYEKRMTLILLFEKTQNVSFEFMNFGFFHQFSSN